MRDPSNTDDYASLARLVGIFLPLLLILIALLLGVLSVLALWWLA